MSLPDLVGQVLGQYEIRELLGIGGMGAVYRAQQLRLKRSVAVKVLSPVLANQPGYIDRFIREAEIAASLEHNHIVPIYDFGAERDWPYIVMRLLTGGTLSDRLQYAVEQEQPLPSLAEIATLLQQLSSALDYAHSLGVIHRDVKPSNIMFDDRGNAYLVDFGIVKLMEGSAGLTGSGMSMGTPAYMPPEQWRNEPLTPAADLYALGIITYQLLTGEAPFRATTPYGYMHQHLHEMPPAPHIVNASVPSGVAAILERAIAKDPGNRFESVTAFADAFRESLRSSDETNTGFFTRTIPRRRTPGALPSSGARRSLSTGKQTLQLRPAQLLLAGAVPITIVIALLMLQAGILGSGTGKPASETPTSGADAVLLGGSVVERPVVEMIASPEPSPTERFVIVVITTPAALRASATEPATPTLTHTPKLTNTLHASETPIPSPSPTTTEAPTSTPRPTQTPTVTPSSTATLTPTPSASATRTPSITPSVSPTSTHTVTPTSTDTLAPSATPPPTETATLSATMTPTATRTLTNTPVPTASPSPTVTASPTITALPRPSATATPPPIPTRVTATATPTSPPTSTPRATPKTIPITIPTPTQPLPPTPTMSPCELADTNDDGQVDILDIRIAAAVYGRTVEELDIRSFLDFNENGVIDVLDVRRIASQYGSVCE